MLQTGPYLRDGLPISSPSRDLTGSQVPFWNQTRVHLAIITLLAGFIFVGTGGELGIEGDDIFIVSDEISSRLRMWPYLPTMRGRWYLIQAYRAIFALMGHSTRISHLFFIAVYIGSAFLFYLLARRFFSPTGALLSTLFYTSYTGKYETVPVISGGIYHFVIIIFIVSCLIATSRRISPWVKAILITLLNWIGVHLYEILIVTVPLYPMLTLLHRRQSNYKLWSADLISTCLPLLMFATHFYLLATTTSGKPIWMRNPNVNYSPTSLLQRLIETFGWGLNETIGMRHFTLVKSNLDSFTKFILPDGGWILVASIIILLVLTWWACRVIGSWGKIPAPSSYAEYHGLILVGAIYLILFAPLVSFTIAEGFVPPRFTYLGSIGLSLVVGVLSDVSYPRWAFRLMIPALVLLAGVEAIGLHSIIRQYQTSADYDYNIRRQIQEMAIHPKTGDILFLSFPEHRYMFRFWKHAPSKFEQGSAQTLLLLDLGLLFENARIPLHERLSYHRYRRTEENEYHDYLSNWYAMGQKAPDRVYPFFLDVKGKLFGIRSISVIDDGKELRAGLEFPSLKHLPNERVVHLIARPISIEIPWVDAPRKVLLAYWDRNRSILIRGQKFPNDPPFTTQLRLYGQVMSSKTITEDGPFDWVIPLAKLKEDLHNYEIRNTEQQVDGKRIIWKITDIRLITTRSPNYAVPTVNSQE